MQEMSMQDKIKSFGSQKTFLARRGAGNAEKDSFMYRTLLCMVIVH